NTIREQEILATLIEICAQKTGYPKEALDPTMDLEADLGIDTVKQAEVFAIVRDRFAVPRIENLRLKDYPTLAAVARLLAGTVATGERPAGAPEPVSGTAVPATPGAGAPASGAGVRYLVPTLVPAPASPVPRSSSPVPPAFVFDARTRDPHELFLLAKRDPAALGAHLVVVTDLGGHGFAPRAGADPRQGLATGLAKALSRERSIAVTCLDVVDTDVSAALESETAAPPAPGEVREVAYCSGRRFTVDLVLRAPLGAPLPIGKGDVVVATGGAQGIAAECLKSVAPLGPRLVLLGRTALPVDLATLAALTDAELDAKRGEAARALGARGERATPVAVERAVAPWKKGREIARNVAELSRLGASVAYRPCDVADAGAVAEAVRGLGPIVGFVHAAGVEESKLLPEKDEGAWQRVVAPKFDGALHVVEAAPTLRWAVFFGSVAGRFGNAAQTDYAAANDALAKLAATLRSRGVDATCIDWTAWAETGMATRGSLLSVLSAAGVEPLTTAEGVAAFHALAGGPEAEVVVAKKLPWAGDAPRAGRMLSRVVERTERRIVAEADLDAAAPHLRDHAIDGIPVLAGVLTLESFVEAAAMLSPAGRLSFEDAQFHYAIKVHKDRAVVRIEAEREGAGIRCRAFTRSAAPAGVTPEFRLHAEAVLVPDGTGREWREWGRTGPEAAPWRLDKDAIYKVYFHGPTFRVLSSLDTLGEGSAKATLATGIHLPGPGYPAPALEACFQTLGAWGMAVAKKAALPHAIGRVRWSHPADIVAVEVADARFDGTHVRGDARGVDSEGRTALWVEDVALVAIGPAALPAPASPGPPLERFELAGRTIVAVPVPADPSSLLATLSDDERRRYATLAVEKRRAEYVAGAIALAAVGGRRGPDGRPEHASLSHAGGYAFAVAYDAARESVGIDAEPVVARDAAFLEEAFTEGERLWLSGPEDATRAWCVKEAVLKALGKGLTIDLHALAVRLGEPPTVDLSGDAKEAFWALAGRDLSIQESTFRDVRVALAEIAVGPR
ncbi:MAG: SDR family NAD(P)-dependent oxidoreductase, partial [Methanobacteriota archaeon]